MIAVIGAGGHSRSVIPQLLENSMEIEGVFDDNFKSKESIYQNINLVGKERDFKAKSVVLAVGDNLRREKLFSELDVEFPNIKSKSARLDETVATGNGNQFMHGVFVNSLVQMGDNNIFNTNVLVDHESELGNHNHIAVGAIISGRVKIGDRCFIGAGAVVIDKVNICDDVIIGAGAVVTKDITEPGTYVGAPVRKVK